MKIKKIKKTPVINECRFTNGLTLIHLHTKKDPVSACHLFLPGGAAQESDNESGLTSLRWALLLKGTTVRNARRLAEDIESIGASIGGGVTHDYSEISCHSISAYFLPTLKIMGEVLFKPAFKEEEILKEKEALMAAIRSRKESIFSTASEELNKQLFGSHPYSRPASGTEKSVSTLSQKQLFEWQTKNMTPNNALLAVASDIPFHTLKKKINEIFGRTAWPKKNKLYSREIGESIPPKKSIEVYRKEKFEQAYLMMGFPAKGLGSESYIAMKIINAYLGGGMSTRLFQELREKRGLAYDVGSFYPSKIKGSAFVIFMGLQADRLEEAKKKIDEILADFYKEGISETELQFVKNYIKGSYLMDHQTNSQRAHYVGWWRILGKSASFDWSYPNMIDKVTSREVLNLARSLFSQKPVLIEIRPQNAKIRTAVPS